MHFIIFKLSILQSHPDVIQAGVDSLVSHANGMSSVRFICGTNVSIAIMTQNKLELCSSWLVRRQLH